MSCSMEKSLDSLTTCRFMILPVTRSVPIPETGGSVDEPAMLTDCWQIKDVSANALPINSMLLRQIEYQARL